MSDNEVSPEVAADLMRTSLKTAEFAATAYANGRQDALREVRDALRELELVTDDETRAHRLFNSINMLFRPGRRFEIEEAGDE